MARARYPHSSEMRLSDTLPVEIRGHDRFAGALDGSPERGDQLMLSGEPQSLPK